MRSTIFCVLILVLMSAASADDGYIQWKKQLPQAAKAFHDADDIYWRQWYKGGFTPEVAWQNTDPKAVHTVSRPQLKSERPALQ